MEKINKTMIMIAIGMLTLIVAFFMNKVIKINHLSVYVIVGLVGGLLMKELDNY